MGFDYNYDGSKTTLEELEERGFKFEFEYGEWGYDWSITKVFTKDGRVFSLRDSGCSCTYYGEFWADVDETIGAMEEVTSLPSVVNIEKEHYSHGDPAESTWNRYYALGLR